MTILKLLLHPVPVKDAGIQKLVMFSGRSTTFTAKKKKNHFTTNGKQVWRDSTFFLEKAEADKSV